MQVESPVDLGALEIPDEFSLIVVWKVRDGFDGGEVRVAQSVAGHLRSACKRTVARIRERELREYTPDMHHESEEALVSADTNLIADSPLAALLLPITPLALVNAQSLPRRALLLYAVKVRVGGVDIAFVRKSNPRTVAKPGRMFALLGDTLARIGGPVFGLDDYFDLIITEAGIVALAQHQFELLFRETPALQQRIPEWVGEIERHLPLAGDGGQRLAERARTDGRLRRRLRSIAERGHLADVTVDRVRQHLHDADLDETAFLDGDRLRYDDANPFALVYLLNEDYFQGGLTSVGFRSDRKSPR
jgi:hypothetical protein